MFDMSQTQKLYILSQDIYIYKSAPSIALT